MCCLEMESFSFSTLDTVLATSEGSLTALGDGSRACLVTVRLENQTFHGFCSISVPLIDYSKCRANSPVTVSLEAIIKPDRHVPNGHISNAQHLNVPEVSDCSVGVSQYLLVRRVPSHFLRAAASGERAAKTSRHPDILGFKAINLSVCAKESD
jgi:hypothetical protein